MEDPVALEMCKDAHSDTFIPYVVIKVRLSAAAKATSSSDPGHVHSRIQNLRVLTSTLDEFMYMLGLPAQPTRAKRE